MHDKRVAHGDCMPTTLCLATIAIAQLQQHYAILARPPIMVVDKDIASKFERIEVLAFGNLVEDLAAIVKLSEEAWD